ncbi:hypothetical protein BD769DRAFT_1670512 [Suillus cothurnatus]|nr:hypothetical protein BD769DRAFT_1670512 [Suillus cothurnatus]
MSSSISSKHAFSQGGITVSKRQNRLKGDIEPGPTSLLELEELDDSKLEAGSGMKTAGDDSDDEDSWDIMLNDVNDDTDNDADDEVSDFEMD